MLSLLPVLKFCFRSLPFRCANVPLCLCILFVVNYTRTQLEEAGRSPNSCSRFHFSNLSRTLIIPSQHKKTPLYKPCVSRGFTMIYTSLSKKKQDLRSFTIDSIDINRPNDKNTSVGIYCFKNWEGIHSPDHLGAFSSVQ